MELLSGKAFDSSYVKAMKDHKEDIVLCKKEAATGKDPEAKAYAAATLPTLHAHLKKIQAIAVGAGFRRVALRARIRWVPLPRLVILGGSRMWDSRGEASGGNR